MRKLRVALLLLAVALVVGAAATSATTAQFAAFGAAPSGETLARIKASPEFDGHAFMNAEPTTVGVSSKIGSALKEWIFGDQMRAPICPLPLFPNGAAVLRTPPASGLRVTWLGHSTTLVELDGARILTDPVWSERASPSTAVGPKRFHPPPLPLADLPHLDAVVISHEHFDHLDMATVQALAKSGVAFHVPLGIDAHLKAWGVPEAQIHAHDWWQSEILPGGGSNSVQVVSTPARHFNGRGVPGRIGALWTSWSLVGPAHRVFFSGDSGPTEAFAEIGKREGPFDLAMIEVGQYHESWGQIHLGPIGALDAFQQLDARALLPIHWGTFDLGMHGWSEPAETALTEGQRRGIAALTPMLGQPIEPTIESKAHPQTNPWWRALPPTAATCPGGAR